MENLLTTITAISGTLTIFIGIIGIWSWTQYKVVEKQNEIDNQEW